MNIFTESKTTTGNVQNIIINGDNEEIKSSISTNSNCSQN